MIAIAAAIGLFGAIAALWALLDDWRNSGTLGYWTSKGVR
jgi:hypothetical protein